MSTLRILVVDDEESIRHMLTVLLEQEGYVVEAVADGKKGLEALTSREYDLALCDVRMPKMDGLELIEKANERNLPTTIIAMSAFGDREMALDALKRGAYDYIDKPFKKDEILLTLAKAVERLQLERENEALKGFYADGQFQDIVGQSEAMRRVYETVAKVAGYQSTVLLVGESGTGKELVARAIHNLSPRSDEAWVPINCGAIPANLLESELFGHRRGSFTGATEDKIGLFEKAHRGTLFLDEIAELPMALQVKLLRVLQEGEIRRVGDNESIPVDVRIIAASLHNLAERVEQGDFREDLYYRLNVIHLELPPLRERREDIPPLVDHFIERQNRRLETSIKGVTPEALEIMMDYHWPGNVRELQNCIERGVVLSDGPRIDKAVLPERILESDDELKELFDSDELSIKKMTSALESVLIRRALEQTGGNRTHAADLLEISHRALLYKIKDYDLQSVGREDQ